MKMNYLYWPACAVALLFAATRLTGSELSESLQKGLFQEEANHNLPAAIEQYRAVINAADEQRKLTATALYRLAECYRKLGKQKEADDLYSRILRDFSDQSQIVSVLPIKEKSTQPNPVRPVADSNAEILQKLDSSPDLLNAPYKSGRTLLQDAAFTGDLGLIEILLKRGALVDKRVNGTGPTALFFAVQAANKKAAEALIKAGADLNFDAGDGSPLHVAAMNGFTGISELLIANGAQVNGVTKTDRATPLHLAAGKGQLEEIRLLLEKGADIEAKDKTAATPLNFAVASHQAPAATLLVSSNAIVDAADIYGMTPLYKAVLNSDDSLTRLFLEKGANPDVVDVNGGTPLITAVGRVYVTGCALLLQHKANPNYKDRKGRTALHYATSRQGYARITELLLNSGADPNIQDDYALTPLAYAAGASLDRNQTRSSGDPEICRILLQHGAEMRNSIFFALSPPTPQPEVLKVFLEAKANPNTTDNLGRTLMDHLIQSFGGTGGVVQEARMLLQQYGATNSVASIPQQPSFQQRLNGIVSSMTNATKADFNKRLQNVINSSTNAP
jgi:ankyrin repeat protein